MIQSSSCFVIVIVGLFTASLFDYTHAEVNSHGDSPRDLTEDTQRATNIFPVEKASGSYHAHVYVGSPPQKQALIVDTGSHYMAFPCEPCLSCGKHAAESYFDPESSLTRAPSRCEGGCNWNTSTCNYDDQCQLTQRYTEGSAWTAYELEDLVSFGSDDADLSLENHSGMAVPFVFGCQVTESGLFRAQYADGIMGLAMHPTSIITAFHKEGSIQNKSFSLCLSRNGGTLALGGYRSDYHLEPMQYTPLIKNHGWYEVKLESIFVGTLEINRGLEGFHQGKGTIIDSGTTDTYLPKSVAPFIQRAWLKATGKPFSNSKQNFTYKQFQLLPKITLVLQDGCHWVIPPEYYFEPTFDPAPRGLRGKSVVLHDATSSLEHDQRWFGTREFTNRIYLDESQGAVLGANSMAGHDILFDISMGRIGIARSLCDYHHDD